MFYTNTNNDSFNPQRLHLTDDSSVVRELRKFPKVPVDWTIVKI